MTTGSQIFHVKRFFYAGLGWGGAILLGGAAIWFFATSTGWPSFVMLAGAVQCALVAMWGSSLVYVIDENGIARSSRWGRRELTKWSEVAGLKCSEWNRVLRLELKVGRTVSIRYGELREPEEFRKAIEERLKDRDTARD